jgi:quinol-cytochrome oxidoreductase complex cytochrome b subunit
VRFPSGPVNETLLAFKIKTGAGGLIYGTAIHFFAGLVTGSVFAVRTLLGLVTVVLLECLVATIVYGAAYGVWSLSGLLAVQIGYLAGLYVRSVLEHAGLTAPNVRTRQIH